MSEKRRIEGEMACDAGFLVRPECLGQSFESRAACFPLVVRLPRLDPSQHAYNLVAPLSDFRADEDADDAAQARYAGDSKWGCLQGPQDNPDDWQSPIHGYAVVERVRFTTEGAAGDDDQFQHTLDHFGRDQLDWWSRLADWIGVLGSQDLIGLGRNRRSQSFDLISMWITDAVDDQEPGFSKLRFGDIRPYCGDPLTKGQLDGCMALVGEATPPPVAWLLVRDARSLLRSDEYRRAVLDAGTATELALTAMLDKHAAATNSPEVRAQVKRTRMLGNLLKLATKLIPQWASPSLPDDVQQRVIKPRNAAAHEGHEPTNEVAEAAIATATELLNTAYPLSDFGLPVGISTQTA